jgi:hypothetical protein
MIGDVRQPSCALQAGVADDPLGEDHDAAVPGLVHCYPNQVLFLATRFWSSYCRYCTRSRMVEGGGEYTFSASQSQLAIDHMAAHPEIRDVVLSGGDPLTIATEKLEWLLPRLRAAIEVALVARRALGCRDGGRMDLRCGVKGVPQFLEVNPLAGLNPTHSDLPILTRLAGYDFAWLMDRILDSALTRTGLWQRTRVAA